MQKKIEKLDSILLEMNSFVVAFSGGVDSTFLVHHSSLLKNVRLAAVTVTTPYVPAMEINEAAEFCSSSGIEHKIIEVSFPEAVRQNPPERCYLCKKELFARIMDFASANKYKYVADGTNYDDSKDFRPGLKALSEMNVRSPLKEAGLTKQDIRDLSAREGLKTWDKPSNACLLTRIPYNTTVTDEDLARIEKAELYLNKLGYSGSRVRIHGDIARIECSPGDLGKIVTDPERKLVITNFKELGFRFISLDLEGYRTGSMNPDN